MASHEDSDTSHDEASSKPRRGRRKPLIFISHDSRDAALAEAFGNLLTDASGGILKSFRSSDQKGTAGIEFGKEWYQSIMATLEEATDVVALLTERSLDRPWILYEAGVAKGKLGANVIGVAIGVPLSKVMSKGPFAQFQNSPNEEDSLTKLVLALIRRHPEAEPREEAVRRQVAVFREKLDELLEEEGLSSATDGEVDEADIAKLFEEVKVIVRDLPSQIHEASRRRRGKGRFHPMMLEELLFHPRGFKGRHGPALCWLVVISVLKDDIPWLFEPGMNLYRALRSRRRERIETARRELLEVIHFCSHHPMFHEMAYDRESHMLMSHLPEMLDEYLGRIGPTGRIEPLEDLEEDDDEDGGSGD